jgi:lipoate-protein ligase A
MQTKGVASVRSPVCNLRQHKPGISHEDFVHAVVREFQDHYNIRETVERIFVRIEA